MPTKEYLESLLEKAKQYLPDWLMRDLHRAAMPAAGGKARWREPEEPSFLEKMALAEMRPDKLKEAPDEEVRQAWLRLHQWYGAAKKRGEAVENVVNAAIWVMEEFDRRGFQYDENSELVQEAKKLRGVKKAQSLEAKLAQLPQEVIVVPNFVCVVGSSATGKEKPGDIDVLFRAQRDADGENFLVQAQNVWLPVRKVLDPEKKGLLHYIDGPTGPHGDHIPVYDLVLRRKTELRRQIVKGKGDPLEDWEYLLHHMHEPDEIHHCPLVDHLGNRYQIEHLVHGGETYHVVAGLESGQKVFWSEDEAKKEGQPIPCANRQLKSGVRKDLLRLDLGCGNAKPEGYVGIDKEPGPQVDIVHDLEQGIPYPDSSADEIRANHVLEHLSDKEKIMAETHRVLKPGGKFIFEVPSTQGEGAFNHPDHKSYWNKSAFAFWTQDNLLEGRPKFEVEKLEEIQNGDLVYVRGVLRKPEVVAKAGLAPFEKFTPPKPSMAGYTEAYTIDELLEWAKDRWSIAIEPKHNGFRCIAERKGDQLRLWFEGQYGKDQLHKLPAIKSALEKLEADFILDCDLGMLRDGKRAARPDLMKFNAEKPEFAAGEEPVLTVFDVPYWGEDLSGKPFRERREVLEKIRLSKPLVISPLRWCKSAQEAKVAARWAFDQDRSEGLVAKSAGGKYELGSATDEWFKLKRVIELKVIVLQVQRTKAGDYNYWGGLLPSVGMEWRNVRELNGKKYIDLGKTFSTNIQAEVGDIITCEVLELIPDEEKKVLAWLGARVVDVDDTRKEPYTAAQAIDVAKRGQVLQKAAQEIVPSAGPKRAKLAFVGASPGPVEAARGEPFAGPTGETLNEFYLKPLGLSRREVFLTNAVPIYLTDDQGRVREPTEGEISQWRGWLEEELNKASPQIIVALGQTAKSALDNRADFVLPHPAAVRRFGDSGEVARKIKQIKRALEQVKKADIGEEGDTRAEISAKWWAENWHKMFPPDGKGRFIYHHHYRGLSEEETKLDEDELLKTDHSLHGDLRFEADGELWGFSVFLGTTKENRKAGGDRLVSLPKDDNLQGQFKLSQPKAWLDVGVKEPYVSEPGGVGSTSEKYAKFFAIDHGTYEIGVWREHMLELFLHGEKLKGRFLIEYAPVAGGRRVWLIDKPEDQTPYAEKHNLADVISELKQKGQKWLVWAKPGERPQKIDVIRAKVAKEYHAAILKADEEKRIVLGVVLEPDTVDSQGDIISADEIEKAAHRFLVKSRVVGDRHSKKATAEVVESYIAPDDFEMGGQKVKKGSWVIGVHISDDRLWEAVRRGEYQGFSVGGFGVRQEVA